MRYFITILLVIFFSGCSVKHISTSNLNKTDKKIENKKIEDLTLAIVNLSQTVNKKEARQIASISYHYPLELANSYNLTYPPLFHNTLINMNIKKRGFCYHFAQDLIKELKKQTFKTIELKWATHKKSEYWEHNAVLLTAKGQSYKRGIILDAWRDSGKLYWNYLTKDTRYNWIEDRQKSNYYGN